ncbi:host cell division inhibitor Icd-like protein [Escherichia coli]|uniref:host cell division inhibitor Icd-like protein n=1 Tax=Escherichia coli TaxID=562 RepID=UPI003EEABAB9
MLRTVAGDERSARRSLVRDYVLSLAARLPVDGGVPCVIKKPLRPSQRVMTPVNTSALRLTISSTAPAPYPSLLGVI